MIDIIFDFDGTIADSFSEILEVFYEISHPHHELSDQEIKQLRSLPLLEIAKRLHIPWWRTPFLLVRGRRAMTNHMIKVKIFPGISDQIVSLHERGHRLFIISSNSRQNVLTFLKRYKLDQYFEEVYGGIGLFSKAAAIKKFLRRNHLTAEGSIYIGDEGRDVEASKEINIRCISVTWGFSSLEILRDLKPFALAESPSDLSRIIGSINGTTDL